MKHTVTIEFGNEEEASWFFVCASKQVGNQNQIGALWSGILRDRLRLATSIKCSVKDPDQYIKGNRKD